MALIFLQVITPQQCGVMFYCSLNISLSTERRNSFKPCPFKDFIGQTFNLKTMKKGFALLTAGMLTFAFHASAQFEPGTIMVGATLGSAAYTSGNSDYAYDNG